MNLGERILGFGVLALWVGALVKLNLDYDKIGAPTESDEDPFDTPELRKIRADIDVTMKRIRDRRTQNTLHK